MPLRVRMWMSGKTIIKIHEPYDHDEIHDIQLGNKFNTKLSREKGVRSVRGLVGRRGW